jgi:hypothetical protein
MDTHLPESAYKYFWDINPAELDVSARPRYVIERLLDHGDEPTLAWLINRFSREEIIRVLKNGRAISRYSARKWATHFCIPHEEIRVLNGSLPGVWPY